MFILVMEELGILELDIISNKPTLLYKKSRYMSGFFYAQNLLHLLTN